LWACIDMGGDAISKAIPRTYPLEIVLTARTCAGLRALMKRDEQALKNLVALEEVDVLCIQEHKLQEKHVEELEVQVLGTLDGWGVSWSCSTAKAGYSGTAILYSKAAFPEQPSFTHGIEAKEHDAEGRVITMNLPSMYIVNVYVPNSGELPPAVCIGSRSSSVPVHL
jgi:exonuclease III